MSETTQSTVEDFEQEFPTTATEDPASTGSFQGGDGTEVKDDHAPIGPEADGGDDGNGNGNGDIVTLDDHAPIGAESVVEEGAGK